MYNSILVPLDRSAFAEHAAAYGAALAAASQGKLHLVLVHTVAAWPSAAEPERYSELDAEARTDEMAYLVRLSERIERETGVHATPRLIEGPIVASLLEYADAHDVDLIVMSSHGRGGVQRVWLGSVTNDVLRHAAVPMLVVRPVAGDPPDAIAPELMPAEPFRRVLVALDGNELAEAALDAALELPLATAAGITAIRLVRPPQMVSPYLPHTVAKTRDDMRTQKNEAEDYLLIVEKRRATKAAIRTRSAFANDPAGAVLANAERENADLIVVGTHARGGVGRAVLGSVTDRVIRGAHVPVFVMPARALAASRVGVEADALANT